MFRAVQMFAFAFDFEVISSSTGFVGRLRPLVRLLRGAFVHCSLHRILWFYQHQRTPPKASGNVGKVEMQKNVRNKNICAVAIAVNLGQVIDTREGFVRRSRTAYAGVESRGIETPHAPHSLANHMQMIAVDIVAAEDIINARTTSCTRIPSSD